MNPVMLGVRAITFTILRPGAGLLEDDAIIAGAYTKDADEQIRMQC